MRIESGELVYPYYAQDWDGFFQLIKSKLPKDTEIPNPLILGGSGASNYSKNRRLQEHIRIAKEHDLLDFALGLLYGINEEKWVTSDGNLDPNEPSYWELEDQYQND